MKMLYLISAVVVAALVMEYPHQHQKFGGIAALSLIQAREDAYFQANGKYLQIMKGGKLPAYETGTVAAKLGIAPDSRIKVDIYEQGDGQKGYQIQYDDGFTLTSFATGPQAAARTFTRTYGVASSTP